MINIINKIFESAQEKNIPFIFIRPKKLAEPDIYSGDFDLLIKPAEIDSFLCVIHQQCALGCINFSINRVKREKTNVSLFSHDSKNSVEFDLWTELDIKDPTLPKSTYISWQSLEEAGHICRNNSTYSLSNHFSALFYLSHLYSKNKNLDHPEVQSRLEFYRNLDGLDDSVLGLFSQIDKEKMLTANQQLKYDNLLSYSISHRLAKIWVRAQKDIAQKSGVVTVIGPDGVGKTTVINQLEKKYRAKYFRFKKLFRKTIGYQLLLKLTRSKLEKQQGKLLAKNQFDDLQCSKLFWLSLPSGYLLSLLARLGCKKIIDRYYMDLLITGSRFSDKEVTAISAYKRWINIAPTPAAIIQLDAPNQTILSRKEELSSHAIDQFRHLYFELSLASKTPMIVYVNTQNSIEDTFVFLDKMELKL